MTVIVVDDEKLDRYLVRRTVREVSGKTDVIEKASGAEFLEFVDAGGADGLDYPPPNLVLLDINMPGVSGFEVLEALERRLATDPDAMRRVVIAMFTSSANQDDRNRALRFPFVRDYVVKPLRHEQMQSLIAKYCTVAPDAA